MGTYGPKNSSGPHMGLPWPIDIVHKVPISKKLTLQVDDFNNVSLIPTSEEFKREISMQPADNDADPSPA